MLNVFDREYHGLVKRALQEGDYRVDRTGTGAYSIFGHQMRFDLSEGFPLLTTKKLHTKSIFIELLWFLKGLTNNKWLNERGVTIWDEWADPDTGELGPVYGKQWRDWSTIKCKPRPEGWDLDGYSCTSNDLYKTVTIYDEGRQGFDVVTVDQITKLIDGIKNDPYGRRHIVTAWNPVEIDQMALPPCHMMFQMFVANGKLSCQLYQRSVDIGLGLPFNIASYALLTHMIAQVCDLEVGEFVHTSGDAHIYSNHVDALKLQLGRCSTAIPTLKLNPNVKSIDDFEYEDIEINGYEPHPHIKMEVAK